MVKKLFSEIPVLNGERITLRALTRNDVDGLRRLTENETVYRYLPTFLFEKKYDAPEYVISRLYDECIKSSLILGVFMDEMFCGLAEIYGYRAPILKASIGYRLLPEYWGMGVATEALGLLVRYVLNDTNVKILTASTMIENKASARVLEKNGFMRVIYAVPENWGYSHPVFADKWILTATDYRIQYRFDK